MLLGNERRIKIVSKATRRIAHLAMIVATIIAIETLVVVVDIKMTTDVVVEVEEEEDE